MIGNLFGKLLLWFYRPFLNEPISDLSNMKDFKTKVFCSHIENFWIFNFKHPITVCALCDHLIHTELFDLPNGMLRHRSHICKEPRSEKFISATTLILH